MVKITLLNPFFDPSLPRKQITDTWLTDCFVDIVDKLHIMTLN